MYDKLHRYQCHLLKYRDTEEHFINIIKLIIVYNKFITQWDLNNTLDMKNIDSRKWEKRMKEAI